MAFQLIVQRPGCNYGKAYRGMQLIYLLHKTYHNIQFSDDIVTQFFQARRIRYI